MSQLNPGHNGITPIIHKKSIWENSRLFKRTTTEVKTWTILIFA